MLKRKQKRQRRHKRIRAKMRGGGLRPRLCVFKSNKHIYAQIIDDTKGKTIVAASDLELFPASKKLEKKITGKITIATEVGKLIAKKALNKKIKEIVFDRGGFKYHGRVKAVAEGAREGGLKF